MYAIKAEVNDPNASSWTFKAQKTMYGGKRIAEGDLIFVFSSENEGGPGLIASGVVSLAKKLSVNSKLPLQAALRAALGHSDDGQAS